MNDFNPIRDLRSPEADPFNVPAGQSTQEVEDIRLTLVLTREKTENIVNIIKKKGLVFKKDVEKIQELQRRLRKTIPRIPILRGDASVQGGSEEEITRRRFGFDLDFNRRFRTKTKVPTKDPFPFFDLIFTAIVLFLTRRGGKGIKVPPFIKNLFKGKGKGADPTTIDDILKQLDKQIKELEKAKEFVPQSLRNAKKNLELVKQNQTTAARMSAGFEKNKNTILSGKKFAKNKRMFEKELKNLEKGIPEYKIMEFLNKNNITSPTLLRNRLNKAYTSDINKLLKSQKDGKITPGEYVEEYFNLKTRYDKFLLEIEVYTKDVENIVGKSLKSNLYKKYKQPLPKSLQQSNKEIREFIKQNVSPDNPLYEILNKGKSKVKLDGKPMSNDIAMLNTDTSYRDIYIIKVDSDSIG
tara:strand:+ start:1340 stop:2572 length:1233 start_codon:yes stop_codon:yes gene_type:complete